MKKLYVLLCLYKNQKMDEVQTMNIGHYILGRTIGKGAFAKVREAVHDLTGIKVAVKIINKKKMKNKNMISKVKREIKILKFINHLNIIKLYEVLDTTNDIFVIMELASKGELFDLFQEKNMGEDQARFYFRQIINGLEYVHHNLISHRDLKPQNILIDENNLVKIGDFGLSNLMKDGKLLKTACGSPNYAAPQIVRERKYEGTCVDIWSCGVILFALLARRLPFDQQLTSQLYKKIQQGSYVIPPQINPNAKDLISRMLQVDPCRRIKMHDIKNHPWLRPYIPVYAKISNAFTTEKEDEFLVDEKIYQEVTKMNLNIGEKSTEGMLKAIKKRDDESFVIAYELLKDEKDRKLFANNNNFSQSDNKDTIFDKIQNPLKPDYQQIQTENGFIYGYQYRKSAKSLAEILLKIISKHSIEYEIKGSDYNIRCAYAPLHKKNMTKNQEIRMEIENQQEKVPKFSRNQIKFTIQIYSVPTEIQTHLIDYQLTNGHPFVFFSIIRKIHKDIEEYLAK